MDRLSVATTDDTTRTLLLTDEEAAMVEVETPHDARKRKRSQMENNVVEVVQPAPPLPALTDSVVPHPVQRMQHALSPYNRARDGGVPNCDVAFASQGTCEEGDDIQGTEQLQQPHFDDDVDQQVRDILLASTHVLHNDSETAVLHSSLVSELRNLVSRARLHASQQAHEQLVRLRNNTAAAVQSMRKQFNDFVNSADRTLQTLQAQFVQLRAQHVDAIQMAVLGLKRAHSVFDECPINVELFDTLRDQWAARWGLLGPLCVLLCLCFACLCVFVCL